MSRGDDSSAVLRIVIAAGAKLAEQLQAVLQASGSSSGYAITVVDPASLAALTRDCELLLVNEAALPGLVDLATPPPAILIVDGELQPQHRTEPGVADVLTRAELEHTLARSLVYALQVGSLRAQLHERSERHDLLLRASNDGMWEWDLDADRMLYSERWLLLLGLEASEVEPTPQTWFSRVHADDIRALRSDIEALRDGRRPVHEFEHRVMRADGKERWTLSRGLVRRDRRGRAIAIAGSLTDIDARKSAELNSVDELTGLPSRRVLVERLDQSIARSRDNPDFHFSVLFLNLDRFKVLNDSIGLDSADRILAQLAQRLRGCVDEDALLCRYGGDEFAVLLDGLDDFAAAESLAKVIHQSLRQPFELDGQTIFTTASIGITNSARTYVRATDVIRDANIATSRAKRRGKSRSSTFDAAMRLEAVNTLRTLTQLREAIDGQQFEVYYQPIVALGSYRLTGFEALVRWNHPKRGVIGPGEFIALAEETGLIIPLGKFVLRDACSQMAAWHRLYPDANDVSISINLSGHQLGSPTLVTDIEQVLEDTGLSPKAVKLELTESTLIDDPTTATRILGRLRDRGIQLYIDDFGTGYSSLSYLHRFAIDGLKIDKSFVDMVGHEDRKAAIVPSIVGLAHNLGMGVVAEGVETAQQARELNLLDCAEAQGYLFSRPVPSDQAAKLIERRILWDDDFFKSK